MPLRDRFAGPVWVDPAVVANEIVHNILLFLPFGVLHHWGARTRGRRCSVAAAFAAGVLLSGGIEALQTLLPRRHPTIVDVAANGVGAAVGALADRAWGARAAQRLDRWSSTDHVRLLSGSLTIFALVALGTCAALQRDTRLVNWSVGYSLQAGNEPTGDRPWKGRLSGIDITDRATPLAALKAFAAGEPWTPAGRLVAMFRFRAGAPYADATAHVPALDWSSAMPETHGDSVDVRGRPWLQTSGPAARLVRAIVASGGFSLRVQCASATPSQSGPARIVSNAADPGHRNFTLGQDGSALIVRIRMPHTDSRGAHPQVVVPHVFTDNGPRDILVTYDGAAVAVAIAGAGRVHRIPFSPGPLLARRATSLSIESDEHQMLERLFAAGLFLFPSVVVALIARGRIQRFTCAAAWTVAFSVALEATLAAASGRPFAGANVIGTIVMGSGPMALFSLTVRTPRAKPGVARP